MTGGRMNKAIRIIVIVIVAILLAIAALWIWICLNPGVIYCYNGGIYMSHAPGPLPAL